MATYPIENYYVGKLNIGHKMENISEDKPMSPEDEKLNNIMYWTIADGAINLEGISFEESTDLEKGLIYDRLFTLFYRSNKGTYICLHNGLNYTTSGETYCSELQPLASFLPKLSADPEITPNQLVPISTAKWLFKTLFTKNNIHLYNKDRYPIGNYHLANFKMCIAKGNKDCNLPQRLMLNSKGIDPYSGSIRFDDPSGKETHYNYYNVVLMWVMNCRYYNINDHRTDGEYTISGDGSQIHVTGELKDNEFYNLRTWTSTPTIPHVLGVQRRLIKKQKKLKEKQEKEA